MKWIQDNIALILVLAANLVGFGIGFQIMKSDISLNDKRITALENLNGSETRWMVLDHEKRISNLEVSNNEVRETLNRMDTRLQLIAAWVEDQKKPK